MHRPRASVIQPRLLNVTERHGPRAKRLGGAPWGSSAHASSRFFITFSTAQYTKKKKKKKKKRVQDLRRGGRTFLGLSPHRARLLTGRLFLGQGILWLFLPQGRQQIVQHALAFLKSTQRPYALPLKRDRRWSPHPSCPVSEKRLKRLRGKAGKASSTLSLANS